jgi:hypothetical protein
MSHLNRCHHHLLLRLLLMLLLLLRLILHSIGWEGRGQAGCPQHIRQVLR